MNEDLKKLEVERDAYLSILGQLAKGIYEEKKDGNDAINPSHYLGNHGMEAIDVLRNFMTEEQFYGFVIGNALKYILRHQNKNGLEDLKKAVEYLQKVI